MHMNPIYIKYPLVFTWPVVYTYPQYIDSLISG